MKEAKTTMKKRHACIVTTEPVQVCVKSATVASSTSPLATVSPAWSQHVTSILLKTLTARFPTISRLRSVCNQVVAFSGFGMRKNEPRSGVTQHKVHVPSSGKNIDSTHFSRILSRYFDRTLSLELQCEQTSHFILSGLYILTLASFRPSPSSENIRLLSARAD